MSADREDHRLPGRWRHLPSALIATACLAPFVFVATGSLREPGPPPRSPPLVPWPLRFANYTDAFDLVGFGSKFANSLIVAAVTVPIAVVVASAAGFGIARLPRRPRRIVVAITIGAAMLPATSLLIGRFGLFRALGVTDTLLPLMAPALLGESPFHVLFFLWAFRRVPADLFDSARLEGMSEFATYRRVGMPLVRPLTIAVAVATFADVWGAYLEPLVYLSDPAHFTLPLGIATLANLDPTNQPLMLAGALASMAPIIVILLITQRHVFAETTA